MVPLEHFLFSSQRHVLALLNFLLNNAFSQDLIFKTAVIDMWLSSMQTTSTLI